MNQIKVNNDVENGVYSIEEIFVNLKNTEVLLKIFETRENLEDVFENISVIVSDSTHYMHVQNEDATIVIGKNHLRNSEKKILYLDIIHELVHVNSKGRDWISMTIRIPMLTDLLRLKHMQLQLKRHED